MAKVKPKRKVKVPTKAVKRSKLKRKPPFNPTLEHRRTVELMTAIGTTQADIARCLGKGGIDEKTLRKYFKEELATAHIKANAEVGGAMFNKAISGDVGAQKYWMGARAGWKETSVRELTPSDPLVQLLERIDGKTRGIPND